MDRGERAGQVEVVPAAVAVGADRHRGQPPRVQPVSHRVEDREPGRGRIHGVVEAVPAHAIGGGEHRGDDQPVGAERERRQQVPRDLRRQRHRLPSPHLVEQVAVGALREENLGDERGERMQLFVVRPVTVAGELELPGPRAAPARRGRDPQSPAAVRRLQLQPTETPAPQGRLDAQRSRIRRRPSGAVAPAGTARDRPGRASRHPRPTPARGPRTTTPDRPGTTSRASPTRRPSIS